MSDLVNHPPHYNSHSSGVEAIEICESLGFCLGNAVKYLFRCGLKGSEIEDLQKAAWYLRREVERSERMKFSWYWQREAVAKVLAVEPTGSLLGDVLRSLFGVGMPIEASLRLLAALARVEREIEARR